MSHALVTRCSCRAGTIRVMIDYVTGLLVVVAAVAAAAATVGPGRVGVPR
jgi:hypothetical protein